ncbi:MAG: dockerin [Pseudomonadota bacterium]
MNRKFNIVIPALLASLLAACSGGGSAGVAPAGASKLLATVTTGAATTWTSVKWGGGGYVSGLIYHPTSAGVLYARTDIGGAYRWNSNGSWTPLADGPGFSASENSFLGVESIGLDPTNDQRVYMVSGKGTTGGNGRIYVSSDRGNSWAHYNLPFPVGGNEGGRAVGERLKLDPTNPSTMFYASRTAGLWKSTNSGQTWTQTSLSSLVLTNDQVKSIGGFNGVVGVEQIMFDNSNVGGGGTTWIMYCVVAPDYANAAGLTSTMYKSVNGGFSWTPVAVPSNVAGYYVPHMVRTSDGNYYAVFNKNAGPAGSGPGYLYKFGGTTNGDTWSQQPLAGSTQGGYGGVSVYGTGPTARIALAVTSTWNSSSQVVQLSDNDGATWHEAEGGTQHWGQQFWGWVDDIEIDPTNRDHIMHITGGGIWETWNASSLTPSWDAPVNNLEETGTEALITPPAGASYKFVNSAGDIGTWLQTDLAAHPTRGPTPDWSHGYAADMAWSDSNYVVASGQFNATKTAAGFWSGDSGNTWSQFASIAPGAAVQNIFEQSIAVTARNNAVWAPGNATPSYTTNNGASWVPTNLPSLPGVGLNRAYHLAADRRNPNKVYAYDSGGASWSNTKGKVYVSTDSGHTFALSQGSVSANLAPNGFRLTSIAVNPNAEGDIWLSDGNAVYHSLDSGATWTKRGNFASVWTVNSWPDVQGATAVALGKAATGSTYSAAVYVAGTVNGVWGVYRSDDGGASWARFNDDAHQYGGVRTIAGDWNTYGRIYVSAPGRGIVYTN